MAFVTTIKWTAGGLQSRAVLINNLRVVDPANFVDAVNGCIRGWSAMKYSQQNPNQSAYSDNGFGEITWQDGPSQRTANLRFYFHSSGWALGQGVTLSMVSVT